MSNGTLQATSRGPSTLLLPVINDMLKENRLELFKEEKQELTGYPGRGAGGEAQRADERAAAGAAGRRARGKRGRLAEDIKNATSMQQQTLNKTLKVLESRKLVKTVKSVQQKTKKLYMATASRRRAR